MIKEAVYYQENQKEIEDSIKSNPKAFMYKKCYDLYIRYPTDSEVVTLLKLNHDLYVKSK